MWWAVWCAVVAAGAGAASAPAPDSIAPLDLVQMDSQATDDLPYGSQEGINYGIPPMGSRYASGTPWLYLLAEMPRESQFMQEVVITRIMSNYVIDKVPITYLNVYTSPEHLYDNKKSIEDVMLYHFTDEIIFKSSHNLKILNGYKVSIKMKYKRCNLGRSFRDTWIKSWRSWGHVVVKDGVATKGLGGAVPQGPQAQGALESLPENLNRTQLLKISAIFKIKMTVKKKKKSALYGILGYQPSEDIPPCVYIADGKMVKAE
ncbi:unnamed protein product [Diatraea saccharalis]|uniref:Uncharacterized protein n=1 Tax=Diatraea saccharalis TaxID=40085 RepID=A0A9N9N293_9NEOP|nr:unnamed protein product [Diatraea saccharalis]